MKQIRLDEMTDRRKVQYAQMKKKKGLKKSYFLVYGIFILYLIALIVCAGVMPLDYSGFPIPEFLCVITIIFVLVGYKKYHKIMDMYDEIMQERVWEGIIDNLILGEEIEFIDKNNQTLKKTFTGETYKQFVNVGKIHVVYIARLDRWYLEKGEQ